MEGGSWEMVWRGRPAGLTAGAGKREGTWWGRGANGRVEFEGGAESGIWEMMWRSPLAGLTARAGNREGCVVGEGHMWQVQSESDVEGGSKIVMSPRG